MIKKIFKIILNTIFYVFMSVLIVLICILSYSKFIKKDVAPKLFGYSFLVVVTESMTPTIKINSLIVIKDTNNYQVGDIVTYKKEANDYTITHRIVEIQGDKIITKGDANNTSDAAITKDNIIGEVVKIMPSTGMFLMYLRTPLGIIFSLLGIILLIFGYYVINKWF